MAQIYFNLPWKKERKLKRHIQFKLREKMKELNSSLNMKSTDTLWWKIVQNQRLCKRTQFQNRFHLSNWLLQDITKII